MLRNLTILTVFGLTLSLTANVWAYQETQVVNGGSIKGKVVVTGNIPQDPTIQVTKDNFACGDTLPREKYVIGADGGLRYAVVFIEEIKSGKPMPTTPVEIDNVKCAFVPHVQVGVKGQELIIKNTDPMLHNTHIYLDKRTVYNFALPITGMQIKKPIRKDGVMNVQCDAHSWMQGYLYLIDNPYIAVTDANGNFSMADVPPGKYELKIWHEALGEQEQHVVVPAGGAAELKVEFKQ